MVPASAVTQTAYCSHVKATPELSVVELIAVITTIFIKDFFCVCLRLELLHTWQVRNRVGCHLKNYNVNYSFCYLVITVLFFYWTNLLKSDVLYITLVIMSGANNCRVFTTNVNGRRELLLIC